MRAAIVGAGLMGKWHAHAVARCGHMVVAIVDSNADRARAIAREHAGADAYSALGDVRVPVDVVHVCTPTGTHRALVEDALSRGWHVIVEKPLASSTNETRELLQRAEACERLLVPVHQFLFQRGVLEAAALLPRIGPLLHFDATVCTAGAADRRPDEQDRVALEVLPHALALMMRLVSSDVAVPRWHIRHTRAGEVRLDGVMADVNVSALVSTAGRPTTNSLRLIAAHGTVHVDLFHGFAVSTKGRTTRVGKIAQPFVSGTALLARATSNLARRTVSREPAYPGLRELVRRTYDAAANDGPPPISPAETLAVAMALDHIANEMSNR